MTVYLWYSGNQFSFHERTGRLQIDGTSIPLSHRQREVLKALLGAAGTVLTRNQLIDLAWGENAVVGSNAVDQAIARLRKSFGGHGEQWILTARPEGFMLAIPALERHVVGDMAQGTSRLKSGAVGPQLPGFSLVERVLENSDGWEIWHARGPAEQELILSFAFKDESLADLRREVLISQLLQARLPHGHPGILQMRVSNLQKPPCFIGTESGGDNLQEWAEENDRLMLVPFPERFAMGLQLAEALRALHAAGVLHGNISPDSVVVSPEGDGWRVRLADFTCAELTDPTALERHGIRGELTPRPLPAPSGIPLYFAPERRGGAGPTAASDVYALAYLIYQLLAGHFGKRIEPGWERDIEDPLLREDILAAVEQDPSRRIGLIELIHRLSTLEERHEEQRRQSALAAEKAARQERTRAAARWVGAAMVLLALVLSVISVHQYHVRRQEQQREALERAQTRALAEWARWNTRLGDPSGPKPTLLEREQKAAELLKLVPVDHAKALIDLAKIDYGSSRFADAERRQRKAIGLIPEAASLPEEAEVRLRAQFLLVQTLDMLGRFPEANRIVATASKSPLLHEPSQLTLLALTAMGGNALAQARPAEVQHWYEEAETLRQKMAPDDAVLREAIQGGLTWAYVRTGHDREAQVLMEKLQGADFTPEKLGVHQWAKLQVQYALALRNQGMFRDAREVLGTVLAESRRKVGPDSRITGLVLYFLAGVYQSEGRWQDAYKTYEDARSTLVVSTGESNSSTLEIRAAMDFLQYVAGSRLGARHSEIIRKLERDRIALEKVFGGHTPPVQLAEFYLAAALCEGGRFEEAGRLLNGLHADALAAEDAGVGWSDFLNMLRGAILASEHPQEGQRLLQSSAQALQKLRSLDRLALAQRLQGQIRLGQASCTPSKTC